MQGQYTEARPDPKGGNGDQQDKGDGSSGDDASKSNSGGTTGGGTSPTPVGGGGSDSSGGGSGSGAGGNGKGNGNGNGQQDGAGGNGAGQNQPDRTSPSGTPGDDTVARVTDTSATVPSTAGESGGSSPMIWILIAIVVLGGISGFVAMRMRSDNDPIN